LTPGTTEDGLLGSQISSYRSPTVTVPQNGPSLKLKFDGIPSEQAQPPYIKGWPITLRARLRGWLAYHTTKEMPSSWRREILARPIKVRVSLQKEKHKYYMDDSTIVMHGLERSSSTEMVGGRTTY